LVAHSGPVTNGALVQTLVVMDIASGWTELAPSRRLPFPLLGLDVDNDSVFMNKTVRDYCAVEKIEPSRCRPYRKNNQAHVERRNGEIVRRMVGYRRYEGIAAAEQLRRCAARSRQPITLADVTECNAHRRVDVRADRADRHIRLWTAHSMGW